MFWGDLSGISAKTATACHACLFESVLQQNGNAAARLYNAKSDTRESRGSSRGSYLYASLLRHA